MSNKFWLWGQNTSSHQRSVTNALRWKLPDENRLDPVGGAEYLGISNMCRVVMNGEPRPPFDAETAKLCGMNQVVWSAVGDAGSVRNDQSSDLDEVLRQADLFPNVSGAVLDDFFKTPETSDGLWGRYAVGEVQRMRERLHAADLDFWVVWYKRQLEAPVDDYLDLFDVITYWNMNAPAEHRQLIGDWERVVERTPGKRRLAGCYIWNYGEGKPLTVAEIRFECETYAELLRKGIIEGIVFCSNCCADLTPAKPAVDWLRSWIRDNG